MAVHELRYRCGGVAMNAIGWIVPDWPAPRSVRALITTRAGGVSRGAYAGLNLSMRAGDVDINEVLTEAMARAGSAVTAVVRSLATLAT